MIGLAPGTKVFLACQPIDLRSGFDGLAAHRIQSACQWIWPRDRDSARGTVSQPSFPEDARWNTERSAVEFGVEIGEFRVPRRVSQRPKGLPLGLHPIISDKIWLARQVPKKIVVRRNVHQRHPLRDEHFDLDGLRRYGAQPHSTPQGGGGPAFGHRPYVRGDGVGVPWALCRRGVKVRGNPLASSFIASCLNTRPKASSSSASFGPTLPLANRKQRSAWTCRCIASDIVSPVSTEHPPDRHDPVSEAYGTVSRPQSNSEMVTEPLL
jgi:hypothetical protein